jgi:carbon storage regulator
MLVLSRHRDESIVVPVTAIDPQTGQKVDVLLEFMVVDIRGDKVRLGVEAPNFIPVHRREVYEAIQREQRKNPPTE